MGTEELAVAEGGTVEDGLECRGSRLISGHVPPAQLKEYCRPFNYLSMKKVKIHSKHFGLNFVFFNIIQRS